MTIYRNLLQSLRRSPFSSLHTTTTKTSLPSPSTTTFIRTAFTTAEEAAAERRRLKRRLRIEPPLQSLRPTTPRPPPDPTAPRLPDSTSSLTGPRLNLHNRVQSLIRGGDLEQASAVARHSVFSKTRPTVFTCNAIIASMYRARRYDDAIALFQYFFNQCSIVPNIVSYNNLIVSYCETGKVDTALEVYRHIIAHAPFSPSPITYRHLSKKGLVERDRIDDAVDLLREMLSKGHGADSHVYNNIISGYLKLENLERANEFFDELKGRCSVYDGIVNASFMEWYFEKGRDKEAMENYRAYLERNFRIVPATGNVLLETLIKYGKREEANCLFESMLSNHKTPNVHAVNSDTYNVMVNECFRIGNIAEAKAVFKQVGKADGSKPFQMDNVGYNNMIDKLCQNGLVEDAENLFQEMESKHVLLDYNTYKFLIKAYFQEGKIDAVLEKINGFLNTNLKSNPRFYNMVFGGLIDNGRVDDASNCIEKLGEKEVKPDPATYELVIMALLKESKLDRARDLLNQMMMYNVGLTTALKSAVDEAFAKQGRSDELAMLLGRQNQAREWAARGQY